VLDIVDPHVWHDVSLWQNNIALVECLCLISPEDKDFFIQQANNMNNV
jgi:hypothetical protein